MKTALPLFLLTLAAPCYAAAEHTAAEAAVRNANPAEALKLLQNAEDSPQTHYWRGRALVDLQRYAEAFEELQRVPAENELRPYAGMTAVYCARRMSNAEEVLEQLCADTNKGIAAAANAALQELGYSAAEIHNALKGVDPNATTEEMVRHALRAMVMKG